jgi:8-oxo-dGTP pyrophosphatase MutT (NUDIX family)
VIERADGQRGIYGVIDKDDSCLVIPLEASTDGEFLYLVSQYRYTVGKRLMEFPQGTWEGSDADPTTIARGELREETGLRADRMTPLASLQIAYGVLNQVQHIFLAEDLTQGEHERDAEETDLEVHRVSVAEFETMLLDGTIVDNCSVSAWGIYRLWRGRKS